MADIEQRRETRIPVEKRGSARIALSIDLVDVSSIGVRARVSIPLPIGTVIRLGLGSDMMRHARVVWVRDGIVGFEFLAPLNDAEMAEFLTAA